MPMGTPTYISVYLAFDKAVIFLVRPAGFEPATY